MNILLTSVGRRSYLVQYFKEVIGEEGKVHVSNSTELTPAFTVADQSVVTPLIYSDDYIPFLISYCKEHEISALISLFDIDLPILSENKKLFNDIGVKVIVSDKPVIGICNDKYSTYRFLKQNGFLAPKTFLSIDETLEAINNKEINYPLIVKPRWGMGSIGVLTAENEEELLVFYKKSLSHIKNSYLKYESNENLNESVIIQEKLNGQEYGLDVINDLNKEYKNTVVKVKHAMRSGETDCAETVNDFRFKELGASISKKLGHIGNLDVDVFIVGDSLYILEMNARFGGGYPFSHVAGVNLPQAIVNWVEGKPVSEDLLNERFDVLAHKDLSIIKINSSDKNIRKVKNNVEIKQLKNKEDILRILNEFDEVFSPSISEKVDNISDYASKLSENAYVYVAYGTQNLGFVTLYANDYESKIAYISFIGVKKEAQNMKIGKKLLKDCFEKSAKLGMKHIKLEVQKENLNAIEFYKRNGFAYLNEASSKSVYLIKEI